MEGLQIVQRCGRDCVRLMPDVFHMNIEDASLRQAFGPAREFVTYVHVADSNRLAPGWGHIPFDEILSILVDIGHDGWLTAEILPRPDAVAAAEQAIRFLSSRVSRAGTGISGMGISAP